MPGQLAAESTKLKMGDGAATEVFTDLAHVKSINGLNLSLDTIDVTDYDSPNRWEEIVATILRTGTMDLEIHFIPDDATHDSSTGLISKMTGRVLTNFQLHLPTSPAVQWDFAAFVTNVNLGLPHDGALTARVTLKPSGEPTLN